ncbi:unnamed protein product, partial [Polarella glacialis]
VAVVGGTSGIGAAFAKEMASKGADVIVMGRTFRDEGPRLTFIKADLSSVESMKAAAAELPAEDLDMLIFTNGILPAKTRVATSDGLEADLAVSYISRFVILRELSERLGTNRPRRPRVFVMGGPGLGEKGNPADLNAENSYSRFLQHGKTVAVNEALVLDAAARFPRLAVFGLNPGLIKTDIRSSITGTGCFFRFTEGVVGYCFPSAEVYAERLVPVLFAPALEKESGFHFNPKADAIKPSKVMTTQLTAKYIEATEALLARLPIKDGEKS